MRRWPLPGSRMGRMLLLRRLTMVAGSALALSLIPLGGSVALCDDGPLGQFDGHSDVGSPRLSGSAVYNGASQEYALSAAGTNMWAKRDEFHFAWKHMKGDFILQARVELVGKGIEEHRKLGFIV